MKTYNALCNYVNFLNKTVNYLEGLIRYYDLSKSEENVLKNMYYEDLFQFDLRNVMIKHSKNFGDKLFNLWFGDLKE